MFIVILEPDNIGVNAIVVTLLFIITKVLKKLGFLIMNALICIYAN